MFKKVLFTLMICGYANTSISQHNRQSTTHTIGWLNYFGNFVVSPKMAIHTEYQFRRNNLYADWQQSLLRTGFDYAPNAFLKLRIGYAWIETYPYGEIPIQLFGKTLTEHRTFQKISLSQKFNTIEYSNRFMFEQRWIGTYFHSSQVKEATFLFANRFRFLTKLQIPFNTRILKKKKSPYLACSNETFIGFGKNVKENVFDQNRLILLVGGKLSPHFRVELGFINQVLQLAREINNQNYFQYNNGLILNTYYNFNLLKDSQ
jgi:hypothetical protein